MMIIVENKINMLSKEKILTYYEKKYLVNNFEFEIEKLKDKTLIF